MKYFLLIPMLLLSWILRGQNASGVITYVETIKIDIQFDGMDEDMKKMIPPSQTATKLLVFNENETLYKDGGNAGENVLEINNEDDDGNEFNFVVQRPVDLLYTNLQDETTLNQKEFFGRDFLISGAQKVYQWKLSGEKKQIGDFVCQKATLQDTAQTVIAWFTAQIPVAAGPAGYGMLPGMILEMDIDNGQRTYLVTQADLRTLAADELVKPTKGKALNEAEFKVIEAEKLKEMGVETGGNGKGVKMIIKMDRE